MVASANKNAERANDARIDAEERSADLEAELDAMRQLYAEESAAREELEAAAEGGGGGDSDVAAAGELEQQLAASIDECSALRTELYRARAEADDAKEELEAVRELASQEEASLLATMGELTERLKAAEKGGARGESEQDEQAAGGSYRQLEADLSAVLDAQQAAVDELSMLRPKMAEMAISMAELEHELAEERAKNEGNAQSGTSADS